MKRAAFLAGCWQPEEEPDAPGRRRALSAADERT